MQLNPCDFLGGWGRGGGGTERERERIPLIPLDGRDVRTLCSPSSALKPPQGVSDKSFCLNAHESVKGSEQSGKCAFGQDVHHDGDHSSQSEKQTNKTRQRFFGWGQNAWERKLETWGIWTARQVPKWTRQPFGLTASAHFPDPITSYFFFFFFLHWDNNQSAGEGEKQMLGFRLQVIRSYWRAPLMSWNINSGVACNRPGGYFKASDGQLGKYATGCELKKYDRPSTVEYSDAQQCSWANVTHC